MVAAVAERTPNLIPVPPEWLEKQGQRGPNTNRNINDCYWKKGPHDSDPGWIIVGPSAQPGPDGRPLTRHAEKWMRQGREPLVEYSFTNRVSPRTGQRETIETNADRLTTEDRYYWLFANGGAHLFPIEQIVAHHWHINPPFGLSTDAFPQLDEWEVPEAVWCGACAGEQAPRNSEEELVSHLLISHRMTLPQARDLIASYDIHSKPRGARGVTLRRKAQGIERQVEKQEQEAKPKRARLIICDLCGEQFRDGLSKGRHMKQHLGREAASQPSDAMNGTAETEDSDG